MDHSVGSDSSKKQPVCHHLETDANGNVENVIIASSKVPPFLFSLSAKKGGIYVKISLSFN